MKFKIFYEELLYDIFYNSNKLNMQKSDIIQFSMERFIKVLYIQIFYKLVFILSILFK